MVNGQWSMVNGQFAFTNWFRNRGRSNAEKRAKIGIAIEECDESAYWLELLSDLNIGDHEQRTQLLKEADELTAILYSCRNGMR